MYTYFSKHYFLKILKAIMCLFLNISVINHDKYLFLRYFRGTCSSVEILKGYMLIFRNAEVIHAHLSECSGGTW